MAAPRKKPAPPKGEKILKAIEETCRTQTEFARRLGLKDRGTSQVSNWIRRGRIPAEQSFEAGRILGRNPEWLTTDDPSVPEFPEDVQTLPPHALKLALAISSMSEKRRGYFEGLIRDMLGSQ